MQDQQNPIVSAKRKEELVIVMQWSDGQTIIDQTESHEWTIDNILEAIEVNDHCALKYEAVKIYRLNTEKDTVESIVKDVAEHVAQEVAESEDGQVPEWLPSIIKDHPLVVAAQDDWEPAEDWEAFERSEYRHGIGY